MNLSSDDAMLKMHQDAFDLVTEGVLWIEASGKIQYGNEAAASLLGYSRGQLQRTSYFEINPHFSLMGWKKFWNRLAEKDTERLETEFVNARGNLFSVRGKIGFDLFSIDTELCVVVFSSREEGQRESDLLESVQAHGNIGSWEWNLTTNQVYLSRPIREWFDWSPERDFYPEAEFLEKVRTSLVTDVYANAKRLQQQLKQSGRSFEFPLRIGPVEAPGKEFIVRGISVENELEVYKVYGTMAPPAPTVSPVLATAPNSQLASYTLDHTHDMVAWIDLETQKIVYANLRAAEVTGYSRQELIGRPISLFSSQGLVDFLRDAAGEEKPSMRISTSQIKKKNGTPYSIRSTYRYFREEEREYVVVVTQDISQEEESSGNIQLHTTTLNVLEEWVIWLDENHKIVLLNEAARKKIGRKTSRDLRGMPLSELMPDLDIPALSLIRREKLNGRRRNTVDYVFENASGDARELQVRYAQVNADQRYFLCVICRDVTIEYKAKRRLVQTKRRVDELTKELQSENEALKEQIQEVDTNGPIITVSKKYQKILGQIGQVAGTDATVLVTGETGTGKELLAQSIHSFSNRSHRRMVSVNCAALPENLIESELFGHERGSFTGAFAQKKGKFELADGSTIFLDEIGELPLDMQAKLLRALQEGEIQRIGSTEVINVDVRVVAATNRNLERMISEGRFREDLFYRLNVFPIHNPPLRERPEDIPVLVNHFARSYSERMGRNITLINPKDLEKMQQYEFPGNVRELINLVERAVITSNSSTLNLGESLRALRRNDRPDGELSFRGERILPFEEMQRQYIIEALKRARGKVTGPGGAAEMLDVNGRTLMSKMNKLGINRNEYTV